MNLIVFFIGIIGLLVFLLPLQLPSVSTLQSLKLLDRNGVVFKQSLNERQEYVSFLSLSQIPYPLQLAYVVAEDKRFFRHFGIDVTALMRAGSTMSMQVARIAWPELTKPWFKMLQPLAAVKLERSYSKQEILEFYLNSVPFGYQVSGIAEACQFFFNTQCQRLSLSQMAALAVIPRNPHLYTRDEKKLLLAKNNVLKKMRDYFTYPDRRTVDAALSESVHLKFHRKKMLLPHLATRIQQEIPFQRSLHTTLDFTIQTDVLELTTSHLKNMPELGEMVGILVVENRSAQVRAYVGGVDFWNSQFGQIDAVRVLRSPGSTLKPFLYALALEKKYSLSSVLADVPIQLQVSRGIFSPHNYSSDYSGPIQMRYALGNSKNVPAVSLLEKVGTINFLDYLRKMGFENLNKTSDHYGVGLVLGNAEVSLWELVQAYTTLARQGSFLPLTYLMRKEEDIGISKKYVVDADVAYLISDVLSDAQARAEEFGRNGPLEFDFPVAVKTGTSSDYRDHWTVGYTPEYTVGVWRGNSDARPFPEQSSAAYNTGVLFHKIIQRLHKNQHVHSDFHRPTNVVEKRVCSLSGFVPTANCLAVRNEFFKRDFVPTMKCHYHHQVEVSCSGMRKIISYVELPQIYKEWVAVSPLMTREKIISDCEHEEKNNISIPRSTEFDPVQSASEVQSCCEGPRLRKIRDDTVPKILEPYSGTFYALDPTMPESIQEITFRLTNVHHLKKIFLYENGVKIAKVHGLSRYSWFLKKGKYEFQIGDDKNFLSNKVSIQVF